MKINSARSSLPVQRTPETAASPQLLTTPGDSDFECKKTPLIDLAGGAPPPSSAVPASMSLTLSTKGWTSKQLGELDSMSQAVTQSYGSYYQQNPTLLGEHSGTLANLWGTLKLDLSRGCRDHQDQSFAATKGDQRPGATLDVKRIAIGAGAEHHAVVVFPKGTDWKKTGVVVDPWTRQSTKPEDFLRTVDAWKGEHAVVGAFSAPRLEGE